jgi:hypothetical protein
MTLTLNQKVEKIFEKSVFNTKKDLAAEFGISRPTLDSRLSGNSKWKRLEEKWINYLFNQLK